MRKTIPLWILSLLLLIGMKTLAATVEVRTHLWSETKTMSDDWSGYVQLAASEFADAKADNYLAISYTTPESGYAQMALKTASSGWPLLTGTDFMALNAATKSEQTIKITSDMLTELQATGLIVGGCNYTLSGIDLIKEVQTSDTEKGNPVTTIWTGNQPISWTGDKSWLTLNANVFAKAKVGNKLRFNFKGLACGAQAHICNSKWVSITDADTYINLTSSYFEYTLTEAMLQEIQANGCIATGVGFTVTSVELIDPTQVPTIICEMDKSSIKCWEKTEQPQVTLHLQNLESKEQTLVVNVKLRTDAYQDYNSYSTNITIPSGETLPIMNLYLRYFDQETLVNNVDEAIDFLKGIPEIGMDAELEADIRDYAASDVCYPKRYKVRPRIYFIVIKTAAATMQDFKDKKALRSSAPAERQENPVMLNLTQELAGWYEGSLDFKRVVMVPATGKFEYRDTHFVAHVKAMSGLDCYTRIVEHLKERVDSRSQFPSAKGKNFHFRYLGMWK